MNNLEDRLRHHYTDRAAIMPTSGPGLDDPVAATITAGPHRAKPRRTLRLGIAAGTIAAAVALVAIAANRSTDTNSASTPPSPASNDAPTTVETTVAIPGATLPPDPTLSQTPVTVAYGGPRSYWRWLPDLDIAEQQTATGGTELCWRTPTGDGCIDDAFESPATGIIPTDEAAIILARPALGQIANPTTVTALLSDQTTVVGALLYDSDFGVGYARIPLQPGLTVVSATSQ
ncbi:MAG: hypothetical protein JWN62_4704 [Acidimicrobiales bacterium]|nr:hypothetical protein [Acidimicrobiales bacterium]